MAFDRPGHGESDGSFRDLTVSGEVLHVRRLVEHLAARDDVDEYDIHLLGMSLGSVIAGVVAAQSPVPIASLTMWSPAAVFADEIRGGTLQGRSIVDETIDGVFSFNGLPLLAPFFVDSVNFDVFRRSEGYAGPVRILHGQDDPIAPVTSAERYVEMYGDSASLTVVPGADHSWTGPGQRDLLATETVDFIAAHSPCMQLAR